MVLPLTGIAAVETGLDIVAWSGAPLTKLNCVPGAAIALDGLAYFIAELVDTNSFRLTRDYAGGNGSVPAEITQVSPDQVATATLNKRAADLFAHLSELPAWADVVVEDDAARLALETENQPLDAEYRVLVKSTGMIWAKKTSTYGDWIGPVAFKGEAGNKGWSPMLTGVSDGQRRVFKLAGYTGGEGSAPTDNVGKYLKADGTFTATIGEAMDVRGPAGDISGVTPFWQGRITADANAAAARAGLEAIGVGEFGIGGSGGAWPGLTDTLDVPSAPTGTYIISGTIGPHGGGGSLLQLRRATNNNSQQLLFADQFNRAFFRGKLGAAAYREWAELWHSQNLPVVTEAEAQVGTGTTPRAWPPQRIAQAIAALAPSVPADVYRRSNILAPVSQSGGMPEGGIIERGQNASGSYVRFADGTQICWHELVVQGSGAAMGAAWTFPSLFASAPNIQASMDRASKVNDPDSDRRFFIDRGPPSINSVAINVVTISGQQPFSSNTQITVNGLAIGRWL